MYVVMFALLLIIILKLSEIQPSMSELEIQPFMSVFADFHVFIVFIIILNCSETCLGFSRQCLN